MPLFFKRGFVVLAFALSSCGRAGDVAPSVQSGAPEFHASVAQYARPSGATGQLAGCPCVYVGNIGNKSVAAFSLTANGDAKPLAVLEGSNTQIAFPTGIAFDHDNRLYVSNLATNSVTVYAGGATGDATPVRTIVGGATGLNRPNGIAVDSKGEVYVTNAGLPDSPSITVYAAGANGDARPIRRIAGGMSKMVYPSRLDLDASGNVFVGDSGPLRGSGTRRGPGRILAFPADANGNVPPSVKEIMGSQTGLEGTGQAAIGTNKDLYATNGQPSSVTVYSSAANGNVAPVRTVAGAATGLDGPSSEAIGPSGDVYVANIASSTITVYGPSANGNIKPIRTIGGSATGLDGPIGVAIH